MNKHTQNYSILSLLFMLLVQFSFSQTAEQRKKITQNYDKVKLLEMQKSSDQQYKRDKAYALEYAKQNNIQITINYPDGRFAELQKIKPDGTPVYYITQNDKAAKSTRTNHINIGGSTGFNLDGQNMVAYVWDGGHARESHQEYDGPGGSDRVTVEDAAAEGGLKLLKHAGHVVGTIGASGVNASAKGMAPRAQIKSYKWSSDLSEAYAAAANGMLISNHSYGYRVQDLDDWEMGAYGGDSRSWDALHYSAPYYLMVTIAGNDGTSSANGAPLNPSFPQYDKLTRFSTSKNNMVVANGKDANVDATGNLISVTINPRSSQGPTDDYRIKPDITGNGTNVYSSTANSDTSYSNMTGTSMAAPNVAGSLLLLQEHYNNINNNFMRSATLKGLALHTADDAGMNGPDAIFGWGLMNAKRAAETISENGTTSLIQELTLSQGQSYTIQVEAAGIDDLMASISWTDPAGFSSNQTNNTTPRLINDLDIRITKNTDTWFPWRLIDVNANANDGDNIVDPFERAEIDNPSGSYTITVTHKGNLVNGSQDYSLIVTGIQIDCTMATVPENIQVNDVSSSTATISWDETVGALYDLRYRENGTTSWINVENLSTTSTTILGLDPLTEYEVQVKVKCSVNISTGFSPSVLLTTDECIATLPENITVTNITDTAAAVNWDEDVDLNFDLRYRQTDDLDWIVVDDIEENELELSALIPLTEYEVQVRSKCLGDTPTAYSASVFFTTEDLIYCDSQGNSQNDEYIGRVQFADIDNTSADENDGYSDFTSISTPVDAGENYAISITPVWTSTVYNEAYAVWIDFNQNGDFTDAGELVFSQNATQTNPVSGNINIPISALEGETRMRVSMKYNDIPNPCEIFNYGEVEDYTVEIYKHYIYNNGAWTPNNPVTGATPSTISDNISVLNGTANISGVLLGNDLTVLSGATLEMDAPATSATTDATVLNLTGDITNDGNITFKSDANGSAQFDEFTGTISGTGNVTVERFIPAEDNTISPSTNLGRAFRFLTSTVTTSTSINANWQQGGLNPSDSGYEPNVGTHITGSITGANGFDATPSGNPSMFTFNNASSGTGAQNWTAIPGTDGSNMLKAGRAYLTFVRGDRSIDVSDSGATPTNTTLKATGSLLTGPVDYLAVVDNMATTEGHYSLVANPYQAVVNYNNVTKSGLTNYIYVWDATINSRGKYVAVDLSDNSNDTSGSDASNFLAPGQAFFVQNDAIGNGSLIFNENNKATSATQVTVFSTNTNFTIQSSLYKTSDLQNGNGVKDGLVLQFSDNYTTIADYEDAVKFDNPDEKYAIVNNGLRSIDKQAMPTIGHEIDLSINNYRESNYSLTFDMENKPENIGVFLNDNYIGSQTELSNGDVYDFSVDENIPESIASDRFSITFDNTTLSINDNVFGDGFNLYPNPTQDGRFSIKTNGLINDEVSVKLYNVLGQQVFSKTFTAESNGEINVNASNLSSGVYLVELKENEQSFISKLIVE